LRSFRVVADDLISKATVLIIVLILTTGTISMDVREDLVFASTGEEGGGEEDNSNGDVEGDSTTEGGEDEEGTEVPDDEVSNDDVNTEGVASEQESACPAVAFEGPSYVDENGCPVPCPPPPSANAQDANIPEGCPQAIEKQTLLGTQLPEEQLTSPAQSFKEATGGTGGPVELCEDLIDNDIDGVVDEQDCQVQSPLIQSPKELQLDFDNDGVPDSRDNCPYISNSNQANNRTEGEAPDLVGDACDDDTHDFDSDGVADSKDNCRIFPNPDQTDADGDGKGDVNNNCGPIPGTKSSSGPCGGFIQICPPGRPDAVPLTKYTNFEDLDEDKDGFGNDAKVDNCQLTFNPDQMDSDGDGKGDACDEDSTSSDADSDGFMNSQDNCLFTPNPDQKDTDGDGEGDLCELSEKQVQDTDMDGDGVPNSKDNCPPVYNPRQTDDDLNGIGDICDNIGVSSADTDGLPNNVDNCPLVNNVDQKDTDGDGKGDACDP
jgi:Thrombospondin type 3 repeat